MRFPKTQILSLLLACFLTHSSYAVDPPSNGAEDASEIELPRYTPVIMDGLREAEAKSQELVDQILQLPPDGTLEITHIGPIDTPEFQVFLRLLRAHLKEIPENKRLRYTIRFVKTDPEAVRQRLEAELPSASESFEEQIAADLPKLIQYQVQGDTPAVSRGVRQIAKSAWFSASAWLNHLHGVTKKGITWIKYRTPRKPGRFLVENSVLGVRIAAVSYFLYFTTQAKNLVSAGEYNTWLGIAMTAALAVAMDWNPEANRKQRGQGKNWDPETGKFEDNQKGFLFFSLLHSLMARQLSIIAINIHFAAPLLLDKFTMTWEDFLTGVMASLTGMVARVPGDSLIRMFEKKRKAHWKKKHVELTARGQEPPEDWIATAASAVWGLAMAGLQVNKITAYSAQLTDVFFWMGIFGAGVMTIINRDKIFNAWDHFKSHFDGSAASCATLLRYRPRVSGQVPEGPAQPAESN